MDAGARSRPAPDDGDARRKEPNASLTPTQKAQKKALKRQLKLQSRVQKMEKRIRHARSRNDCPTEQQGQRDLVTLIENNPQAGGFVSQDFLHLVEEGDCKLPTHLIEGARSSDNHTGYSEEEASSSLIGKTSKAVLNLEQQVKSTIMNASNELFLHVYGTSNDDDTVARDDDINQAKVKQREQGKQMLKAMTKGTQQMQMFQNSAALWGYARQKCVERAMLLCTSFLKLHPDAEAPRNCQSLSKESSELRHQIWERLANTEKVVSIGSGPGNDILGVLALHKCLNQDIAISISATTTKQPPEAVLLDWAINNWEETIIKIFRPILVRAELVDLDSFICGKCDVTASLNSGVENDSAMSLIAQPINGASKTVYITSYLLSETRGQWHDFYLDLIHMAEKDSIFYFCEPTPWQLHKLIRLVAKECIDFLWVDSSMYFPDLQPMDGRAGPAVLVGMKR